MVVSFKKYQKIASEDSLQSMKQEKGLTLIEMMVVLIILGVIAAIAIPSYKNYAIVTKRTDMMVELQNRGAILESRKIKKGAYKNLKNDDLSDLNTNFPVGNELYKVNITSLDASGTKITSPPHTANWTITATPIDSGQMSEDGDLSLNYQGVKCREVSSSDKKCGVGEQWKE